jgi:arylsulfatase
MRGYQASIPVARYADDGVPVASLPEGFYSTIAYTDLMIGYVDEALADEKPFFGWLAYTAPHWPTHALDADMAKTRGRYDEGYDVIRERRFARWKALGFAPADAELPRVPVDYKPWDALSAEEQAVSARTMEVYAAMVERMDAEIGRLLAHLEARGALENTLVVFMSDNGAEGNDETWGTVADYLPQFDNSLDNIGRPGSYRFIGRGWAEAGSAPFLLRKTFATEGGVHVPAIVSAPGLGITRGRTDALAAVFDLAPTFLELAGATDAPAAAPADLMPITGRSFAGFLRGEPGATRGETETIAWEMQGHRAVRRGRWKAEWILPPHGPGAWQLFDLAEDQGERNDLAAARPDVLAELTAEWDRYAAANGVIVIE